MITLYPIESKQPFLLTNNNFMKTLKCDVCGTDIQGENFDAWFKAMHAHYMTAHADMMKEMMSKPKEEGEKWMTEARAKFEAA